MGLVICVADNGCADSSCRTHQVHVYQVSPALTVIEKETATQFARLFGFNGPHAGGLTFPGGSASNWTSMLVAKNTLYPETKVKGNGGHRFVVFSSEHGHYSVEKAAILLGIGSDAVWNVKVDEKGRMDVNGGVLLSSINTVCGFLSCGWREEDTRRQI